MTSPSDRPGIPPLPDTDMPQDPRPISTPQPMPEEAPGYDAPVPVYDPPVNPDTPGMPLPDPTSNPDTPGIRDPMPMSI